MQGIDLLAAFGEIKEKYVLEAESPYTKKKHSAYGRWIGIAAGICLFAGLVFASRAGREADSGKEHLPENMADGQNTSIDSGILRDFDSFDSADSVELPKINPSANFSGDMGMGCYTAKEVWGLQSNPAGAYENTVKITTMPVYKRKNQESLYGLSFLSEEDIEEGKMYLTEIANKLGWDIDGIEEDINEQTEGTQVTSLTAKCEQGTVGLGADACLFVSGLNFVPKQGQEESDFVTEIMKHLQCVSGFSKTMTYVWKSYDLDGQKSYRYYGYEGAGSQKEQIQNCALSQLWCYVEDNGSIDAFRLYHYRKNTICLGEYPIINRKKAEELLFQGKYCSQYAEPLPENAEISACELTYVPELASQVLIPYYSFLVEVQEYQKLEKRGLKTYAKFYVPAVQEKYFSDSFQWEFAVD